MVVIYERWDSRESSVGSDRESVELSFIVAGTEDDSAVRLLVNANAPLTYQGLLFQDYTISPQGGGTWEIKVRYGLTPPRQQPPQLNDYQLSFDTSGGTQKITQSKGTVEFPFGAAPLFQGAIGVNGDTVEGCEIVIPQFTFQEQHHFPATSVTGAYLRTLRDLTGKINDATFRGFAAYEVLFLGARGVGKWQDGWEITYNWAVGKNETNLTVGSLTGIQKGAWDYLWIRYGADEDQDTLVQVPKYAYVEIVYDTADFSLLGIGT